jgi:hypothetical protein
MGARAGFAAAVEAADGAVGVDGAAAVLRAAHPVVKPAEAAKPAAWRKSRLLIAILEW